MVESGRSTWSTARSRTVGWRRGLGGIEAEEARSPAGQWAGVRAEYADALLSVAGPEFESGRAEGRRLTLVEAIEYALAEA